MIKRPHNKNENKATKESIKKKGLGFNTDDEVDRRENENRSGRHSSTIKNKLVERKTTKKEKNWRKIVNKAMVIF